MSKEEAQTILDRELDRIRGMSHQERIQTTTLDAYTAEHVGPSGDKYKISVKSRLKNKKKEIVRIKVSVREAEGREIVKKIPILGIPSTSYQVVCLMTILTIGPYGLS